MTATPVQVLDRSDLDQLLQSLRARGYEVLGPTVRDGVILYDEISSSSQLPEGWTDQQHGGSYRLIRRVDRALFGYAVGPHSWKRFLLPSEIPLWSAERDENGFRITAPAQEAPKRAFLGVRACDLHAIHIQDRVLVRDRYADPVYQALRRNTFLVAVHCGQAGNNCFCASTGSGPRCDQGFDLALTELLAAGRHRFLVEAGSAAGEEVLRELPTQPATEDDLEQGRLQCLSADAGMRKTLNIEGLKELLYDSYEHPRWAKVAERCLACGNCTQVCPTCFCTTVEEVTDLAGERSERRRKWDSCFSLEYSYIHGGSVRQSVRSRYRQWLLHKMATWWDQFGTAGCTGCGRCITWCPVGIDITEEVQALQSGDRRPTWTGMKEARP